MRRHPCDPFLFSNATAARRTEPLSTVRPPAAVADAAIISALDVCLLVPTPDARCSPPVVAMRRDEVGKYYVSA